MLTAANDGLTLEGVAGGATILDRLNLNTGSYDIDLQAVSNVTLEDLTFTGGYGVKRSLHHTANNTGLTIANDYFEAQRRGRSVP